MLLFLHQGVPGQLQKVKDPVFNDMSKVQNELTSLLKAEGIKLKGKEITKDKNTTSELEVSITNGQNIPSGNDQRKAFGKSIAGTIKNNLKDPNEYDTYQVLFEIKTENGGVTKSNLVEDIFSSTEL
jgi:hypothetical protein